ncbi:unnamed protein product, partial [Mesorhabditis belari]|uniref:Peptidase M1 membrane alanine aminopeptidase domain-containing protein n=1 Tax=Mesorhabditis belari TaxID=2138241 RepID=A0AAF3EL12_9BILA
MKFLLFFVLLFASAALGKGFEPFPSTISSKAEVSESPSDDGDVMTSAKPEMNDTDSKGTSASPDEGSLDPKFPENVHGCKGSDLRPTSCGKGKGGCNLQMFMSKKELSIKGKSCEEQFQSCFEKASKTLPDFKGKQMNLCMVPSKNGEIDANSTKGCIYSTSNIDNANLVEQIAKQWFNQKEPKDKNENWLKESFPKYVKNCAFGEKSAKLAFDRDMRQVMANDYKSSSCKIVPRNPKTSPRSLATDLKGPIFLRMIEGMIGKEKMKKAIEKFLESPNAKMSTEDFGEALQSVAKDLTGELKDFDFKSFCKQWTTQSGFPRVYAYDDGEYVTLVQKSCGKNPTDRWDIPIFVGVRNEEGDWEPKVTMFMKDQNATQIPCGPFRRIPPLNQDNYGLYSVQKQYGRSN